MKKNKILCFKSNNFNLLVINVYNYKPEVIYKELCKKIKNSPFFLKNASVVLDITNFKSFEYLNKLKSLIFSTGINILGICGDFDEKNKNYIKKSGLPLLNSIKNKYNFLYLNNLNYLNIKTKIIDKPVRSGQQIYSKNSDLVIINNVSSGAEIISDENIHIYGEINGKVLAGVSGNINSQIFCTCFNAELISIAGLYLLNYQIPKIYIKKSVRIKRNLEKNILNIEFLK